jgi:hypothetical protein
MPQTQEEKQPPEPQPVIIPVVINQGDQPANAIDFLRKMLVYVLN